ncbi:MAG: hypothetical protein MUF58_12095, partial [Arcicella sp.]|nr:hypothetical protein [Arcicella sp.]
PCRWTTLATRKILNLNILDMKNIRIFKALLIVQTLSLFVYTIVAFNNDGYNLFNIFLSNIQSLNWNGQFNSDFSCYLILSGLWIGWRNHFTPSSILLGIVAMILGIIIFAPYLLYLLTKENGDLKKVLIGNQ